ncbi:MAG: hypothetical protein Q9164_000049 [Protoblastenia rupestris]
MPHKHRRDKSKSDPSHYDLPPTNLAHPLAVAKTTNASSKPTKKHNPHQNPQTKDDTPRAFTRLLAPYRPPRSGQDDGTRPSKKRKLAPSTPAPITGPLQPAKSEELKIKPNEPLSYFAARVDAALPFAGLSKTKNINDPKLKHLARGRKTKTEKKMQRMQREWREEDKRRKDRSEGMGRGEEGEGVVDEDGVEEMGVDEAEGEGVRQKARKGKGKGREAEDEDPWAHIKAKRQEGTTNGEERGLVGLHDVVQAPPRFTMRKASGQIKKGEGGMTQQIELGEARKSVVQGYRTTMRQRHPDAR